MKQGKEDTELTDAFRDAPLVASLEGGPCRPWWTSEKAQGDYPMPVPGCESRADGSTVLGDLKVHVGFTSRRKLAVR